jgi:formamidopyrimidine-DNA glycosylase
MGPDALMEPMDGPSLQAVMVGRRSIKVALMDQARIAGIGNIHAVEALWRAGILPQRSCQELSVGEYGKLAISLVEQLRWTIAQEENGEIQYVSDKGSLNPFQVYGRESESCTRCSDTITSKKDSGRTTFWCPGCQV